MKTKRLFFNCAGGVMIALFLNSCNLDNNGYSLGDVWYSLATVNPLDNGRIYSLTLDDGKTLWPAATRAPYYKPKANQRAFVYYTILSDSFQGYNHAVQIHDIRNILTKPFVDQFNPDSLDVRYGKDPLKIMDMWMGDGYLNVQFGFNYGGTKVHYINLIHRPKGDNPYVFELRHHAYGDPQRYGRKGLAAFDLSKLKLESKEPTLTVLVKTFKGDKEYTIKYKKKHTSKTTPYSIKDKDLSDLDFVATK